MATPQTSSRKLVIYQMMTRLFGNKATVNRSYGTIEENGVGKFNDIDGTALNAIRELGATHIWYTGIIAHATLTDYTLYGLPADHFAVVKGRAGSPYAIRDYYDVDPDLAADVSNRMQEFEALVRRTHEHGMKAIIDFVPNHVARGYQARARPTGVSDLGAGDDTSMAFRPDNNFYYIPGESFVPPYDPENPRSNIDATPFSEHPAKVTGNDVFTSTPDIHTWYETVKLNYGIDVMGQSTHFEPVPDTWVKMRDILLFWTSRNVDGFRCDMAEMVPVEFWAWVIPQVRHVNPDVIFIAEIYNPTAYRDYIRKAGFDYLYDKVLLYDTLRLLTSGQGSTLDVVRVQHDLADIRSYMLHFIENHDEQRAASQFFAGDPWRALPALVVSATIDAGPIMIYFGQEVGEPGLGSAGFQRNDGRTTIFDYWGVPEHQKWMNDGRFDGGRLAGDQKRLRAFYRQLLTLTAESSAIHLGEYIDLTAHNVSAGMFPDRVQAFLRFFEDERLLIVSGFNPTSVDARLQVPAEAFERMGLDPTDPQTGYDLLDSQVKIRFDKELCFPMKIKPFGSFIFKIG